MASKEQGMIHEGAKWWKEKSSFLMGIALLAAFIPTITVPALMVAEVEGAQAIGAKVVESLTERK